MIDVARLKRGLSKLKFEVRRVPVDVGQDPFRDMKNWNQTTSPIIFDVGANLGQTIEEMRRYFPQSHIHSFEPSPRTCESSS